ncbi:hypothetical protein T4D_4242 [Trichinella pseudospiralis]|uniref:Uncharacterized protein n=1 Tax=Trichinella pseudospiralis TaxID=6337 RepID=A0A0V1FMT5_TRIPS|nr:hypothetical protein T4D_4242 [Trichinella pseudospiralis]
MIEEKSSRAKCKFMGIFCKNLKRTVQLRYCIVHLKIRIVEQTLPLLRLILYILVRSKSMLHNSSIFTVIQIQNLKFVHENQLPINVSSCCLSSFLKLQTLQKNKK